MSKKGQSISINTIIVAAIALAVLVVLFAIFTGRLGLFSKSLGETDTCSQKCTSLNMKFVGALDTPDRSCGTGFTYIPGSYVDAKNGCCCEPQQR